MFCVRTLVPTLALSALLTAPVEAQVAADAARRVAEQWLAHAQRAEWGRMVPLAQATWRARYTLEQTRTRISNNYDFFDIRSWKVLRVKPMQVPRGVALEGYTVTVQVETQLGRKFMTANVIREGGRWGVNPTSAMLLDRPR